MSTPAAAYDLGLRIAAALHGSPALRTSGPTFFEWHPIPAATLTHTRIDGQVLFTFLYDSTAVHEAEASTVLHLLGRLAATLPSDYADKPDGSIRREIAEPWATVLPQLYVVSASTLDLLLAATDRATNPYAVAALILWRDALRHPGSGQAVNVLAELRARYATANPQRENDLTYWAGQIGLPTNRDKAALTALAGERLSEGARPATTLRHSWVSRWQYLRKCALDNKVYRTESPSVMAQALASEQAAAQWHNRWMIATDTRYRRSEKWTGRVVSGPVTRYGSDFAVTIGDVICRHRPGSTVTVSIPPLSLDKEFAAHDYQLDVAELNYQPGLGVVLILSLDHKPNAARDLNRAVMAGATVTVTTESPDASNAAQARTGTAIRRRNADQRSWLSGKTQPATRRDVPWDVMVAAAS